MDDALSAPQTSPSGSEELDGLLSDLWPGSTPSSKTDLSASKIKTCIICGTQFEPRWKKVKTCSTACGVRLGHEKRGNKQRTDPVQAASILYKMPIRLCIICQGQYKSADARTKTCGPKCKAVLGHRTSGPRKTRLSIASKEERSRFAKKGHAKHRSRRWPVLDNKKWLSQKYIEEEYSQQEVAELVGCSRIVIKAALLRQGVPLRAPKARTMRATLKVAGPNNCHWKGGLYNGQLVGQTQRKLQWRAIKRRLYEERGTGCEWCKKPSGERRHSIHHLIPFRVIQDHSDDLLVILCRKCRDKADTLFRRLAEAFFVSASCPELSETVSTLKSEIATATTQTDF